MTLDIRQAILHVLDTSLDTPVLSETPLELTADTAAFLTEHVEKAAASDEQKSCAFEEGSPFLSWPLHDLDAFVPTTGEIALRLFQFMRIYPDIPAADALMIQAELDGAPHFILLKLNYRESYIHYLPPGGESRRTSILRQRTVLPAPGGKAVEACFVNLSTGGVRVLEKKYTIDGKKAFYFSSQFLGCSPALSEKQKLQEVRRAAESVSEMFGVPEQAPGPRPKRAETRAAAVLCEKLTEDEPARVAEVCEELCGDNPAAREEFHRLLREKHVDPEDTVRAAPAAVRRMEKQSLRTPDGVEVKIPVNLYESDAVEFISNPDGTISLLIKNIQL